VILPEPELCITGHAILSDIARKGYLSGKIGAVAKYPLPERKSLRRSGGYWQRYWVNSNFAESISGDPKIAIFATEKPIDGYEGVRIVSSTVEIRRGADTNLMRLDRADWEMFVEKIELGELRLNASQWAFDPTLDEVFETAISEGMNANGFSRLFIKLRGTEWWRYAGIEMGKRGRMRKMRRRINEGLFGDRMSFVEVEAKDGSSDWKCRKWVGDIEGPIMAKDEIWVLDHDWPEQTILSSET
jgi:hypothetical protein